MIKNGRTQTFSQLYGMKTGIEQQIEGEITVIIGYDADK
jgi:hypothetical protein